MAQRCATGFKRVQAQWTQSLCKSSLQHPFVSPQVAANPSIERTCPGKPGRAAHVKRYTIQMVLMNAYSTKYCR
ncbi:hypothetical protein ASJ36_21460 [Aeromonas sp. ARM81]|nr:hypothetical protein ASJ36_21460 [Aeromonas sp. ARM81]